MMNSHEPKRMDDPIRPVSKSENKTMIRSITLWIGMIAALLCIPIFNFLLVPLIAVVGMGAYILYNSGKFSKPGETEEPSQESSRDVFPGITPPAEPRGNRDQTARPNPPDVRLG